MDRLRRPHRLPLLWWALPVLALTLVYASDAQNYPVSGFGGDSYYFAQSAALGASGPLGGLAAWQAGRLRLAGVWEWAPVRHRYRIALDALRPVLLVTVAIDVAAFALTSQHFGALPRLSDLGAIGMMLTVQLALVAVGFGMGSVLPRAAAVPLAVVGLTMWLLVPPALEEPTYRHLTGLLLDPVTVVDDAAPEALLAPLLVAAGALAAILFAALPGRWWSRTAVAVCCVVAGVVPAHALAADAGYDMPTTPRAESAQRCAGEAPRICVPVEFAAQLPRLAQAADTVLPRLEAAGLTRPRELVFASRDLHLPATTWRVELEVPVTRHQITDRVVTALVPPYKECADLPDDTPRPSTGPLTAWLRLAAGGDRASIRGAHSAATLKRVDEIRERGQAAQLAWVEDQRRGLAGCDPAEHRKAMR